MSSLVLDIATANLQVVSVARTFLAGPRDLTIAVALSAVVLIRQVLRGLHPPSLACEKKQLDDSAIPGAYVS